MKRNAVVVNVNGRLMAEIVRTEACGQCHACDLGRSQKLHYPLPDGNYKEGDAVTLEVADRVLGRATLLAYGLPLVCLLAGLGLGMVLFRTEWAQAITAVGFLLIGFLLLAITEKKRKKNGLYTCQAHQNKEEDET